MLNQKTFLLIILFYLSLIAGYFYGENLNYGTYYDWISANKNPIIDFSNNFLDTFINYEKYGHRHSPVYLIFLSWILKVGIDIEYVRLIHLHLCLFLVFLFYKCLLIKFSKVDKQLLLLLSLVIFLSPTFRSIAIWPDSRIPGLIFFTLSIFYFLKFTQNHRIKFAWLCTLSLIISSYISLNFSVFIIYFFYLFLKKLKLYDLSFLIFFAFISSLPMFYYLFVMDVNFIFAGGTQFSGGEKVVFNFNLSNKILIISTIFLFHFIPFTQSLLNLKKLKDFTKDKFIFIFIFFILLVPFFNYSSEFTGGGIFFQLSNFIFKNNYLFYFISFFSILLFFHISKIHYANFWLIFLIILSNVQNSIYHKYYEPMFMILIFTLFKNLEFEKFFNHRFNFIILYLFSLGFILCRVLRNYFLI